MQMQARPALRKPASHARCVCVHVRAHHAWFSGSVMCLLLVLAPLRLYNAAHSKIVLVWFVLVAQSTSVDALMLRISWLQAQLDLHLTWYVTPCLAPASHML